MTSCELRIDSNDGNPYTHESFLETYPELGQQMWDRATVWGDDGILRIRTASVSPPRPKQVESDGETNTPPPPEWHGIDFPSISPEATNRAMNSPPTQSYNHYAKALSPATNCESESCGECEDGERDDDGQRLTPDAPEFQPGAFHHTPLVYSSGSQCSSNQEFETLPHALWVGTEIFPQPIADEESGCIDWESMIATWSEEQWREFGIKYFYGYIQQSSLLMGHMPME